jgi:hypothetical protein
MMIGWLAWAAAAAGPAPAYFPAALTEPRLICDAMRPADRVAVLSGHEVARFGAFLAAAGEAPLASDGKRTGDDMLRFVWLRTFDAPIVVRIARRGKAAHLVATRLTGQGGYDVGTVADRIARDLAPADVARLRARIAASDLDQLPARHCERTASADGALWLFEHAVAGDYHFVLRKTGEERPVRDLGALLLELAGWAPGAPEG